MASDEVIYRFLDQGSIHGIPARDLTQRDLDRLNLLQLRDVRSGKLYEAVSEDAEPPQPPAVPDLDALTKAQLVAYAAEHGIDLGDLDESDTKAELVETIRAGGNSAGDGQQSAGDGGEGGES